MKTKTTTNLLKSALLLGMISLSMSCNVSVSTNSGNKTAEHLNEVGKSTQKIRNQIQFEEAGGLKVESAFLMLDKGDLVAEDNIIRVGERFKLILKLSGWQEIDGKVHIGAGEQLLNSNNVAMLRENDLFANTGAVSEEDAQVITLTMEVLNTETIYDFYQTDFKVWNKNADQHVYGSYQFKLQK